MEQVPNFCNAIHNRSNPHHVGKSDLVHSTSGVAGTGSINYRGLSGRPQVFPNSSKSCMHGPIIPHFLYQPHHQIQANPACMAPSFHTSYINLIIKGIKRINAAKKLARVRLPITITMMRNIQQSLAAKPHQAENRMVWAACCTGFFGFLRSGEFLTPDDAEFDPQVHLGIEDLQYTHSDTQPYQTLHIKASKTDQFHVATAVTLGATKLEICPVAAVLDYLSLRSDAPGPLFRNGNESPLRRRQFVLQVQGALMQAGVSGELFNGHSFRIGAAMSASQAGIPETTIKTLGRWQSMAYQSTFAQQLQYWQQFL